jgi:hypothetical protein
MPMQVGSSVLSRVLSRLKVEGLLGSRSGDRQPTAHGDVHVNSAIVVGLDDPDDAALVK